MRLSNTSSSLALCVFLLLISSIVSTATHGILLQCLYHNFPPSTNFSEIFYTPNTLSYTTHLNSTIQNLRFLSSPNLHPLLIIAPKLGSHVQASVTCCRENGIQLRVRSGGHDFEGLSYLSEVPYVIVDLLNFRSIDVDVEDGTAWVQAGATIGELYYKIAENSGMHGFPAGIYPTVGVGGHFSGGGFGTMVRKYGLAGDNIVDAYLVDAEGRILNRDSMGEDLFWAITGGGGASFGVILSYKLKLVTVPPTVTVFTIQKSFSKGASMLVHRWQYIADKLHENLYLSVTMQGVKGKKKERSVQTSFQSLFLGKAAELLPLIEKSFPELGLRPRDCLQLSWIESVIYFAGYPLGTPLHVLKRGGTPPYEKNALKGKFDFVQEAIPEKIFKEIHEMMLEEVNFLFVLNPMGGKMKEISESETPFPHRKGNLYNIQYYSLWKKEEESRKNVEWVRRLYMHMSPYVSKSPRGAYVNCRDLELGKNGVGSRVGYSEAEVWGLKYFKNNFKRLAVVKGMVDEANFFRHEQSIPPLTF